MTETIVVAGATGYAGRHIVAALHEVGHRVRAIVRSRERAEQPGPFHAPSLEGLVDEWVVGDITDPAFTDGICDGADRVASALGVTRQHADPWDIDFLANLRLLTDAEHHSVRSFTYINVMHVWSGSSMILRSKAAFTAALIRSEVSHQVINPSGYFSDMSEFLAMAKRGVVLLPPRPESQINPIHGADLAEFCRGVMTDTSGMWDVGGPDQLTYREVAQLAFDACGKAGRTVVIPSLLVRGAVSFASHLNRRSRDLLQFFADGLTQDAVGQKVGDHHLADYFRDFHGTY